MQDITHMKILGNLVIDYLTSVIIFLCLFLFIRIIEKVIVKRLTAWAQKTKTTLDDFIVDLIQKIAVPILYVGAFYVSATYLNLTAPLRRTLDIGAIGVVTFFAAKLAVSFVSYGFEVYWRSQGKEVRYEKSLTGIQKILKVVIWGLAAMLFLDNMGYKVSTVLAGLGIGGIAVALAAQAVLGDLFSYFSILFDRPFEVGDFIIVGEYLGVVDHIGIKTTRITSLGGEQLVFSNTDLTSSRVRNYKRMEKRRVVFKLGVTYDTSLEKVKKIPQIIEKVIREIDDTIFDRAHFFSFADFSLVFEVVYYVVGSDYNKYMDIQQKINFAIKEEFEKLKVEFAFPTQTLHISKE